MSYHKQWLAVEDERVSRLTDTEDVGFGVRVLHRGAWGFAGSHRLTPDEVERQTRLALEIAAASATTLERPVELVPEPVREETFRTPYEIDPFRIPIDQKTGLLLEVNRCLLKHPGIRKAFSHMFFSRVERLFMSTEGSVLSSEVVTSSVGYEAVAVGENDAQSREYAPPPLTKGYENIDADDLLANTERVAQEALAKLQAEELDEGYRDIVVDGHNLALTIHESVGHATELDRALGMEESLAGRTFATPEKLYRLQYGSSIVNLVADNTLPHGLATQGFDDEGVAGQRWFIVREGLFVGYSTSREVAGHIGLERSTGACRADHWSSIPIIRIPNLLLLPGPAPLSPEELMSDIKDGVCFEGMGSFSIDQMRCNFQFGADAVWRIRHGRKAEMLKNVVYQSITTDFWNACEAICDERFWRPYGVLNCGKGDPMQIAQMTHGAAPARFHRIRTGTART